MQDNSSFAKANTTFQIQLTEIQSSSTAQANESTDTPRRPHLAIRYRKYQGNSDPEFKAIEAIVSNQFYPQTNND